MTNLEAFKVLGLTSKTLDALAKKGFETPSEIQSQVIPLLLANEKNIIGQADTGTGKTAAFGIPLIELLTPSKNIQAIILVPTRELAVQVAEEISSLQSGTGLQITSIYGGASYETQNRALKRGVDIVVGTPGRIMDHMDRGSIKLDNLAYFILDEADEMLNMGFLDDIKKIFAKTKKDKRVLLFSATMPNEILSIVKKYMGECQLISAKKAQSDLAQTEQFYLEVNERDKFEALCRVMDNEPDFYGIVFCKTKADVDFLFNKLHERGYMAQALHGDIAQKQRENILKLFKNKKVKILIATDVAARGIDVNDMTHVVNYNFPQDPERYVHRIGRTGRAGKTGKAITFVTGSEYKKLGFFQRATKSDIKKAEMPEIKNVIKNKQTRLKSSIYAMIEAGNLDKYGEFVSELLVDNDANKIIAALLKMAYQNELSEDNYRPIDKAGTRQAYSSNGSTRLFLAIGKLKGYSPRSLVEYIYQETGVSGRDIDDVRVMEDFSFVTVPSAKAEIIISKFKSQRQDGKSLVSIAKESSTAPSRDSYDNKKSYGKSYSRDSGSGGYKGKSNYGKPSSGYGDKKYGGGYGDKKYGGSSDRKSYGSSDKKYGKSY
ncbi:MAG: DEAD/DEAH box helicase [Candidatus Absconditicoccaceae bacterium]